MDDVMAKVSTQMAANATKVLYLHQWPHLHKHQYLPQFCF